MAEWQERPDLRARERRQWPGLEKSKFKGEPGFGDKIAGYLMLTYHQDECWYRNLRIRELPIVPE